LQLRDQFYQKQSVPLIETGITKNKIKTIGVMSRMLMECLSHWLALSKNDGAVLFDMFISILFNANGLSLNQTKISGILL
jgi:hypothetical protein